MTPLDVLTLPYESRVNFVECSKFLKVSISIFNYVHVVPSLNAMNTCTLKLSMIKEVQIININEHLFCLKSCCLTINEDKVIIVFDTCD